MNTNTYSNDNQSNSDPITGEPGAHPVGTGIGAALGGAAAGAAVGTVAGPIGTLLGAAAGAVVGGLSGKAVAENIDPTAENVYWKNNFASRPYIEHGAKFDDYGPAYGLGVGAASQYQGRDFEDVEPDLSRSWDRERGDSSLTWDKAKSATRDAWDRVRSPG